MHRILLRHTYVVIFLQLFSLEWNQYTPLTTSLCRGYNNQVLWVELAEFKHVDQYRVCVKAGMIMAPKLCIINSVNDDTCLTLKHGETHGCVVSTVATDALVLKHQAISIHNAD